MTSLLEVTELSVEFTHGSGVNRAVRGVSFALEEGRILGIVGESGSGKSATTAAIAQLLPPSGRIASGEVRFRGEPLTGLNGAAMTEHRGHQGIAIVLQNPAMALNPVMRVGEHIAEVLRVHDGLGRKAAWQRAVDSLARVGILDPYHRARDYPHQFSGGMQQRVMIAVALATRPALLLADEPTTALDPTIEEGILRLLKGLCREEGVGLVMVTHDLRIAAAVCDEIAVMYQGSIVESGLTSALMKSPQHAYTKVLLDAVALETGTADVDSIIPTPSTHGGDVSGGLS
jgi:ABC-type dipeptide/oligopeptide/nickel transport system ATPase component